MKANSYLSKGKDNSGLLLTPLINQGDGIGGDYNFKENRDNTSWQYLRARPFLDKTQEEVNKSTEIIKKFKDGLRRNGLNVK